MKKPATIEILVFAIVLMLGAIYLALSEFIALKALEVLRERDLIEPDFDAMKRAKAIEPELDLSAGIKEPK